MSLVLSLLKQFATLMRPMTLVFSHADKLFSTEQHTTSFP
jgi:hypothetical protein